MIEQICLLSNLLASLLTDFKLYDLARDIYKAVNNVEMVLKIF
jgi:hypothetical protein